MTTTTHRPTGPVTSRTYVENSHRHYEMTAPDGRVLAHRWQHIVTGIHVVTDLGEGAPIRVYMGRIETEVAKAWVKLYKKYNYNK